MPKYDQDCKALILSWTHFNPRSQDLALFLGGTVVFMPWATPGKHKHLFLLWSWMKSAVVSVATQLSSQNIKTVIVMAPPNFATLLVTIVGLLKNQKIYLDIHSGAFLDPNWRSSGWQIRLAIKLGATPIFTNSWIADTFVPNRKHLILNDPIWCSVNSPEVVNPSSDTDFTNSYFLFPSSDSNDEPLDVLISAAKQLGSSNISVYVTGNKHHIDDAENIKFLGFLPQTEYNRVIAKSVGVLALTTREGTAQRSAYEAIRYQKPIICSNTFALRQILGSRADFVNNQANEIANSMKHIARMQKDAATLPKFDLFKDLEFLKAGSQQVKNTILDLNPPPFKK